MILDFEVIEKNTIFVNVNCSRTAYFTKQNLVMIRIENGRIYIPVGHSLWIINKLLREKKELSFHDFKEECNNHARSAEIIEKGGGIDDNICGEAFDRGIERLKYLLKLDKSNDLLEYSYDANGAKIYKFKKGVGHSVYPDIKYSYLDFSRGRVPACKIDEADCVKFIDKLFFTGKIFSTQALYSELENEYCWVEFFVNSADVVDNKDNGNEKIKKAELYRKCYTGALKKGLQRLDEYLIVKDMDELLIRNPCFYYKKQYDYHYAVAGMTVFNEQGELPKLTLYDRLKIYVTKYFRSEVENILKTKKSISEGECYLSISEIKSIADRIKSITDNIKEKQVVSSLKINLSIISEICATKADGWQRRYVDLLDKIREEFKNKDNYPRTLVYADFLASYAQFLGKYGYDSETEQNTKSKWFETICSFYDNMMSIAKYCQSNEKLAKYSIKYANFLRKESKYKGLNDKYSEAIEAYKSIIKEKKSVELNHDYAYALRSYSKFLSENDRLKEAIETLEDSLYYIDKSAINAITDTYIQLSLRYSECGDSTNVEKVLKKALENYILMAEYDRNYYANIANVYIKLLRNISPENIQLYKMQNRPIEYEDRCLEYISKYEKLKEKNINSNDKIYAYALTSLSLFYLDLKDGDRAKRFCESALKVYQSLGNNDGHYNVDVINHHFYLGRVLQLPAIGRNEQDLYDSIDKIKLAHDFYTEKMKENSPDDIPAIKKGLADTNLALAETYDYMDDHKKDAYIKYTESITLYSELDKNEQSKGKYKVLLKKAHDLRELLRGRMQDQSGNV